MAGDVALIVLIVVAAVVVLVLGCNRVPVLLISFMLDVVVVAT